MTVLTGIRGSFNNVVLKRSFISPDISVGSSMVMTKRAHTRRAVATRHTGRPSLYRRRLSDLAADRIGFIGLGNMVETALTVRERIQQDADPLVESTWIEGSAMATNLAAKGHDLVVYDTDESKAASLVASVGADPAPSLRELAQMSSCVITMLPDTDDVEAVYLGDHAHPFPREASSRSRLSCEQGKEIDARHAVEAPGLLEWVRPGTLMIDSSTIDPLASRRVNTVAAEKGVTMIDAPVSGGVPAAMKAALTFMVGGTKAGVDRARPLLMTMGTTIVHCGEAGAGCIAKVCNNLSLAVSMVGVVEAMSLGSKMGMDPKILASVLNASTARCWSSDTYNPYPGVMEGVPSSRDFEGGFAASLMKKDLHIALQAARSSSQSLPMGALAHQLYSLMCGQGHAGKDFSGIFELLSAKRATDERRGGGRDSGRA